MDVVSAAGETAPERRETGARAGDARHGTTSGYKHQGCRCEECKRAYREYMAQSGGNRRVGNRAVTKRRADENLKHPCPDCGQPAARASTRCAACAIELARTRRREIAALWNAGATYREIMARFAISENNLGSTLAYMRKQGWDIEMRGPRGVRPITLPTADRRRQQPGSER
jgi:hypothetical protein